jgi:hypothetical protein
MILDLIRHVRSLTALSLLAVLGACSSDEPEPYWPVRTVYAHDGVGFAGAYTQEYEAVLEQSRAKEALQVYLDDLESSDPAIRLYGLLGLKIIGSEQYRWQLDRFLVDLTQVPYGTGGCVIMSEPTSWIAQQIDRTPVEDLARYYYQD